MNIPQAQQCSKVPVGGNCPRAPYRKWNVAQKDLPDADQAQPIRIVFGRVRTAGVFITPLFNVDASAITQEITASKK